jgi:tryptophan-rich sensory protein
LVVLALLWIMIAVTMWQFYRSDERAGDLMIPYLLWVTFAGYLNLGVYLLNR